MAENAHSVKHEVEPVDIKIEDETDVYGAIDGYDHKSSLLMELIKTNVCQVASSNTQETQATSTKPGQIQCKISSSDSLCIDNELRLMTHIKERPLSCIHCHKVFSHDEELFIHLQSHLKVVISKLKLHPVPVHAIRTLRTDTKKNMLQCSHCSKVFSHNKHLLIHLPSHLKVVISRLEIHPVPVQAMMTVMTHTQKMLPQCSFCSKVFSSDKLLIMHSKSHLKLIIPKLKIQSEPEKALSISSKRHSGEKKYKCSQCEKTFSINSSLIRHQRIHIGDEPYKDKQFSKTANADDNSKAKIHRPYRGGLIHNCIHCNKKFNKLSKLESHIRIHTGEKPFKCSHCNKVFKERIYLISHLKTHIEDKPHQCNHCIKVFRNKCDLKSHLRTHTGEKPYTCKHCNKIFKHLKDLKIHIRMHTGEKPYNCSHCNKAFKEVGHLKSHLRIHTGEKPYHCSICVKSFSLKHNLISHQVTHSGEKRYQCDNCDKTFSRNGSLFRHLETHNSQKPYRCSQCDKSFKFNYSLIRHQVVHTGDKPYNCSHCKKAFSFRFVLTRHLRTHTGEKYFTCRFCNKSYTRKSMFEKHLMTHIRGSEC